MPWKRPRRASRSLRSAATAWTLPISELALLSKTWAGARDLKLEPWVVTYGAPARVFGHQASTEVADLLERCGVSL